jgi:hypothetical protein
MRARDQAAIKAGVFILAAGLAEFGLMTQAQAVCPVCTVAVTTGVGLSRWLGVDDTITGLWIGGVIVSLIIWSINWMDNHNIRFKGKALITAGSYYLLVLAPLYLAGFIGQRDPLLAFPINTFWGVDKLVLGIAAGSVAFYAGAWSYERLKERNKGHAYFPFQKVLMPLVPLILLSPVFYLLTKRG